MVDLGHIDVFFLFAAIAVAVAAFVVPFQYRRRNVSVRGITDTTRTLDGAKFLRESRKLYGKYFENKEISNDDLEKAAEQVRSDLIIVQGFIESKVVNSKRVYSTYSDIIVKTVDAYKKFLEEFEPHFPELDVPIQRIYTVCSQWVKEGKLIKQAK